MAGKLAIIAAMAGEVGGLVGRKPWRRSHAVRTPYGAYEALGAIVICAGIGGSAARSAAQQVLALQPRAIISAGLAGALTPELKVGTVVLPHMVVGSGNPVPIELAVRADLPRIRTGGVLVSAASVAGPEGKRLLRAQYGAQMVDMEAAPVAEMAARDRIPFMAVKCISDEFDFPMPDMEPFITPEGRFLTGKFVAYAAVRPRLWSVLSRLASNSKRASQELCRVLRFLVESDAVREPRQLEQSQG